MPTNLPPEYFKAEERYKLAHSLEEKIISLDELIGTIPKHKGTDKLRADLRRKLSKLKTDSETKKKTGKHDSAFHVDKEGAGRVIVLGAPNTGKSSLITALTGSELKISEYPFTTFVPHPWMMDIEAVHIQLIDTPAISIEHSETELFDLLRTADLVLLLVDIKAGTFQQLEDSIQILAEHRISPIRHKDKYPEDKYMNYLPFLLIVNKTDDEILLDDFSVFEELLEEDWPVIPVSTKTGHNLDQLKFRIYNDLEIMRIYSKPPGKDPDMNAPFVLKKGSTLDQFAANVHQDFIENLKTARIWGTGVHDGQMVGREHVLHDGDIVELHL